MSNIIKEVNMMLIFALILCNLFKSTSHLGNILVLIILNDSCILGNGLIIEIKW